MTESPAKTINIILAALGGEGGGVFTNWLIEVAESNGWLCQSTSLAGVAQRTGATIYYLELFPNDQRQSRPPVMSLFPAQGDIDIAISSEIAEAGRMLQRGFITPDNTTLVTSTHRVYGITEKSDIGDGTMDASTVLELAAKYSQRLVSFDMSELAKKHNSVISSALFGALAGSNALPFSVQSFKDVIVSTGKAVKTNLAAFDDSYQSAQRAVNGSPVETYQPNQSALTSGSVDTEAPFSLPLATSNAGSELLDRVRDNFPIETHELIYYGLQRLIEYQDFNYANHYLDKLDEILKIDQGQQSFDLTNATARYLALWMCFEDIPRVAQLKIRASRIGEIRQEVQADAEQIIHITEFFRPRPEEICAMLPKSLGRALLSSRLGRRFLELFAGGKKLRTDTLAVYFALRVLASFRAIRRRSLGYDEELRMITSWLDTIKLAAARDPQLSLELALCGRLVKGYGTTRQRTTEQVVSIAEYCRSFANASAKEINNLRLSAIKDDANQAFNQTLIQYRNQC